MATTPATPVIDKLDSISFGTFWAALEHSGSTAILDLQNIRLITPSAIVQLAAGVHALAGRGYCVELQFDNSPVRSYLERARFMESVEGVAAITSHASSSAYAGMRGSNPMLVEVTKIDSGRDLPRVLDQIVTALRGKLRYLKHDAFDIATVVSEVCQNTFDHNHSIHGFLAMQGYGKGSKRFLEIGISDHGDGLLETLRRNPRHSGLMTDLAAIQHAIQLGTSEHDDPTRGTGLHHLMEITYRHGGTVQIASGCQKVRFRMDRKKGWSFPVTEMPGVHVALTLPTKRT